MENLTCKKCNKVFSKKSNLTAHLNTSQSCSKEKRESITCEYCKRVYVLERTYIKHQKACAGFLTKPTIEKLETTNETNKAKQIKYKKELIKYKRENTILSVKYDHLEEDNIKLREKNMRQKEEIERLKSDIIKLREDLSFEKGHLIGLREAKPVTITTNNTTTSKSCNNTKVNNIPISTIKPFTIECISELLPQYTYEHFLKKHHGILEILLPFTSLNINGSTERNIVCTDSARAICYTLSEERLWTIDNGMTICGEILKVFLPDIKKYTSQILDNYDILNKKLIPLSFGPSESPKWFNDAKEECLHLLHLHSEMSDFYKSIICGSGKDYESVVKNFRDILKPKIHINYSPAESIENNDSFPIKSFENMITNLESEITKYEFDKKKNTIEYKREERKLAKFKAPVKELDADEEPD